MSTLKCGFADTIITPKLNGTFLDGYGFRLSPAETVRDDIHAKVCAMEADGETHLIFSIDLLGLNPPIYKLVLSQIADLTGVPKEHIALTFIHTHAAPCAGLLAEMPQDYDYFAWVGELCGKAALRAMERVCPGSFDFAVLPEQLQHCYNRRGRDGIIDRTIRAAAFYDEDGKLRGVFASAACHAVINKEMSVSADWLRELNKLSSDELPYLYFQGRAADIDPYFEGKPSIEEKITVLGKELSESVAAFLDRSQAGKSVEGDFTCRYEWVTLPMMDLSADDLRAAVKKHSDDYFAAQAGSVQRHITLRYLQWNRHMLDMAEKGEPFEMTVPLQLMSCGREFVFAFVPFELLTLTGNKLEEMFLKVGFARERIYICGYCNSVRGYLAPEEEFAFGGYEVEESAAWFDIPRTCKDTEKTVLSWFAKQTETIR